MKTSSRHRFGLFFFACWMAGCSPIAAQMITGTWKGRINRQKVEIKIIQRGDSLTGTSYYYESGNNFRRYSIRGYFDQSTNSVLWWDDQLIEEKSGRLSIITPGRVPMLSRADFNCPGDGRMMLDGQAVKKEDETDRWGDLHLDKSGKPVFEDEWDPVIENYTTGANDPEIIDSVAAIALQNKKQVKNQDSAPYSVNPVTKKDPALQIPAINTNPEKEPGLSPAPAVTTAEQTLPVSIEEKFVRREKIFIKEIPISGDTVELRFYDNAEIDGDSISLFLNNRLLYRHIRLTGNAYIVKLALSDLPDSNELTMVAENLGTIPPNTSYMIAMVNGVRHDAYLASSEGSSAMIRLVKTEPEP
ncbi:MAG: hypothetical protein ACO25B_08050 [Chitinophagaceae bacterium]